ncbi:MAG: hypothetical protein WA359_12440 [Acidimicrobiales bacterium]
MTTLTEATAVEYVSGTLSNDATWSPNIADAYVLNDVLTVPIGLTLTIEPGTVVKAFQGLNGCAIGVPGNLCIDGALDAIGTVSEPITFTSTQDNSIGDDTGDGTPNVQDWSGIYVGGAGTLNLEHSTVEYAGYGASAVTAETSGTVTVDDDVVAQDDGTGVEVDSPSPTIENNSVVAASSYTSPTGIDGAFEIYSSSLNLNLITGNSATGGTPTINVGGTVVTSTLQGSATAWAVTPTDALTVPVGVTLTIAPGAVIKALGGLDECGIGYPGNICVEGTLDALGTSQDPIAFTSVDDNTLGGATGSGSPAVGDWSGFYVSGAGAIDLEYVSVSWAGDGLTPITATTTGAVTLINDSFNEVSGQAIDIDAPSPTIENSSVSQAPAYTAPGGDPAFIVESSSLNFNLISGNTASGGTPAMDVLGTAVTSTMQAQAIPWALNDWLGTPLDVPSGVTLTIDPGAMIKSDGPGSCPADDFGVLCVEGTLDANGTSQNPIIFTSINDNSIGGVTGTGSPAAADWGGVFASGSGSVNLDDTTLNYGQVTLSVTESASANLSDVTIDNEDDAVDSSTSGTVNLSPVTIEGAIQAVLDQTGVVSLRGTIENDTTDVTACDWDTNGCSVDAAYVDWGSNSGPSYSGMSPAVCGAVAISPWDLPGGGYSTGLSDVFDVPNCDGTATPDVVLANDEAAYGQEESQLQAECDADPTDCALLTQLQACSAATLQAAENTSSFPYSPGTATSDASSWLEDGEQVSTTVVSAVPFAGDIFDAAEDLIDLAQAYISC